MPARILNWTPDKNARISEEDERYEELERLVRSLLSFSAGVDHIEPGHQIFTELKSLTKRMVRFIGFVMDKYDQILIPEQKITIRRNCQDLWSKTVEIIRMVGDLGSTVVQNDLPDERINKALTQTANYLRDTSQDLAIAISALDEWDTVRATSISTAAVKLLSEAHLLLLGVQDKTQVELQRLLYIYYAKAAAAFIALVALLQFAFAWMFHWEEIDTIAERLLAGISWVFETIIAAVLAIFVRSHVDSTRDVVNAKTEKFEGLNVQLDRLLAEGAEVIKF